MIFEEDYRELEDQIFEEIGAWTNNAQSITNNVMGIIKIKCEENFAEYDIKFTKREGKWPIINSQK